MFSSSENLLTAPWPDKTPRLPRRSLESFPEPGMLSRRSWPSVTFESIINSAVLKSIRYILSNLDEIWILLDEINPHLIWLRDDLMPYLIFIFRRASQVVYQSTNEMFRNDLSRSVLPANGHPKSINTWNHSTLTIILTYINCSLHDHYFKSLNMTNSNIDTFSDRPLESSMDSSRSIDSKT